MQKTIVTRQVDKLGRVHIPTKIRKELNINESDLVVIETIGDEIIIGKALKCCKICGKETSKKIKKAYICDECIADIKEY